jgi:Ca2+-binding RTX toxin-like protein
MSPQQIGETSVAAINFAGTSQSFDFTEDLLTYTSDPSLVRSSTEWSWIPSSSPAYRASFRGSDFNYDGSNVPTSGGLTSFDVLLEASSTAEMSITELTLNLGALALIATGLSASAQNDLVWRALLAGDDIIQLGNDDASGALIANFAADGRAVIAGSMLVGGYDRISGFAERFSADYYSVAADATVVGGSDVLEIAGGTFAGDAFEVSGFLVGGNDQITVSANATFDKVFGDAEFVVPGGWVAGGNDTIRTLSSSTLASNSYGDAFAIFGTLIGGDDVIIADDPWGGILYGDVQTVFETGYVRAGNDTILGSASGDWLYGDVRTNLGLVVGGNDKLYGRGGFDELWGNGGDDLLDGGADPDVLRGEAGNDTLIGGLGTDTMEGGIGNDLFVLGNDLTDTLGDDGGTDTILTTVSRNLTAKNWLFIEHVTLQGTAVANLVGNGAANTLIGNTAANVLVGLFNDDTLRGLAGNDTLRGGLGRDLLAGGTQNDLFDFDAVAESGITALTRDLIVDFVKGQDRIDLSTIDAIAGGANNAFVLLARGGPASTVGTGRIGWYWENPADTANDKTIIKINVDANTAIDMTIEIRGLVNLTAADFIL